MKYILTLFIALFSITANSQNVTVNYQTWNPANPPCKLFVNPTNVPATGPVSGVIVHQTLYGQPFYNATDLSI